MKLSIKFDNISIIYNKSLKLAIQCHNRIMGEITEKEYDKYRDDLLNSIEESILNKKEFKQYKSFKE